MPAPDCPRSDDELVLSVDGTIYDRATVLRAAYWYTEHCYIFITRDGPGTLGVHLRPKEGREALQRVAGEFTNTLLDYELRRRIDLETSKIRELLVAKAVSAAGTQDDPPPGDPNTRGGSV
jgi:His-Xaa-Ser system protein HxsD